MVSRQRVHPGHQVSSSQWPTFEEVFGERVETVVTSPLKVEAANSNEEGEPVVERVEA